ncbi:MAG: TonB-dependent receptor [Vicinamibacterales bacterium]
MVQFVFAQDVQRQAAPRRRATLCASIARAGLVLLVLAMAGPAARAQNLHDGTEVTSSAAQAEPRSDLPDLGLEDLLHVKVYAASRVVQDVTQAPSSVTVVFADEIRRQGYRTLADVLRGVRGFYVTNDRNYSYVGVRGFLRPGDYNGRILLLVNGHRMNDSVFEQALVGTESPIDISLIERVEVIRGPSSSLYGTSAFFAVVNLITRTGHGVSGVEGDLEAGAQAWRRGRVTMGGRSARGFEGLFSLSAFATDGNGRLYFPEFATSASQGVAADADNDRAASLYASGSLHGVTAQASFGSRTKVIPTAPFETVFGDDRTQTRDVRGFADLQYTRRLDPRTHVSARASYDRYDYDGTFAYETGLFHDDGRGTWLTGEASVVRQVGAHALTAGAEYRHNLRQDQSARDETGLLLDDRRHSRTAGVFAEDEYRLHPRVLINAGVRWDEYFGIFGGTVNPRVGVIVSPTGGSTVKALYGRAFRAPNPFELYYDQDARSARLRPERIRTFEIVWEQRLAARLQVSGSAFGNRVSDLITQRAGSSETIDGLYYANADAVRARGVEVELQGELPGRVHVRLAQVVQAARLLSTGRIVSNSPRALATLVLDMPVPRSDAVFAFNGFYVGERRRVNGGVVAGAFVGNMSVTRRPSARGVGVGLTVYNVFGAAYGDPGSVEHRQDVLPQDGRTAMARLSWRF